LKEDAFAVKPMVFSKVAMKIAMGYKTQVVMNTPSLS
jgi:hypothetical protein